jgi:hypothetical protein
LTASRVHPVLRMVARPDGERVLWDWENGENGQRRPTKMASGDGRDEPSH